MANDTAKALRKIEKQLVAAGWTIKATGKGKQYLPPHGSAIVTVHNTPSDVRALKNIKAQIARAQADSDAAKAAAEADED